MELSFIAISPRNPDRTGIVSLAPAGCSDPTQFAAGEKRRVGWSGNAGQGSGLPFFRSPLQKHCKSAHGSRAVFSRKNP
jgi:hypothetical protein